MSDLEREICGVLNRHCAENESNTPDFILAQYLIASLSAFNGAMNARAKWYGRFDAPGEFSLKELD